MTIKTQIDVEYLRERYAEERQKRVDAGPREYNSVTDEYAHFWSSRDDVGYNARSAVNEDVDVLIIGGGMGGLSLAGHCKMAGISSIRIIDKAGDFGGVWFWNQYPGAACDVESYVYMPFLEETQYVPRDRYASAAEIFEHAQRIGRHFDLYAHALFHTKALTINWIEHSKRWVVKTNRGDAIRARFLSVSVGGASMPKLPRIPGFNSFRGHAFHTSRWDFDYTGGSNRGGLTGLQDRVVAVIGTGATAVQVVPAIAPWCKRLFVVQRTPSSIDVRGNRPTDPEWAKSLKPGWARERLLNFEYTTMGIRQSIDMVQDGWTDTSIRLFMEPRERAADGGSSLADLTELADYAKMEELRSRVDSVVKDPETAEALKPYFNIHCKRPCFHDEFLETFNRDNVTLLDTKGAGVERLTETGLVVQGIEHKVDCIILSTGFELVAKPTRTGQFSINGVDGKALDEHWANGYRSLHGMFFHGFPNMVLIGGVRHCGGTFNVNIVFDGQGRHAAEIFARCLREGIDRIEATAAAEDSWNVLMRERNTADQRMLVECTPSNINAEGAGGDDSLRVAIYGGGTFDYLEHLEEARNASFRNYFDIDTGAGQGISSQDDGAKHVHDSGLA